MPYISSFFFVFPNIPAFCCINHAIYPTAHHEEDGISGLKDRKQGGYTNPGAALDAALEMLAGESVDKKYVVLVTDGEISMPEAEEAEAACALYHDTAANAAEQGIAAW